MEDNHVFCIDKLHEQLKFVENNPIVIGKFEARYTVTQLFETGIEVLLSYVIRDGSMLYYDSKETRIFDPERE